MFLSFLPPTLALLLFSISFFSYASENLFSSKITKEHLGALCNNDQLSFVSDIKEIIGKANCPGSYAHNRALGKTQTISISDLEKYIKKAKEKHDTSVLKNEQEGFTKAHNGVCGKECYTEYKPIFHFQLRPEKHPTIRCPQKYKKTHNYTKTFQRSKCDKKRLNKKAEGWVEAVLRNNDDKGKELWDQCPDDCSFYSEQFYQIVEDINPNSTGCSINVKLIVHCDDAKNSSGFFGSSTKYDFTPYTTNQWTCHELPKNN